MSDDEKPKCPACMEKAGYERKHLGAATGIMKLCDGCGFVKVIIPFRHWTKPEQQTER